MHSWLALAAAACAVIVCGSAWRRARDVEAELREFQQRVEQKELQRQSERRGRVAAEQELRRVMEAKLDTRNGVYVQPLGFVRSCFRTCVGTPRQGLFAPSTRGQILFQRNVSPDTLDGLEAFSHLWVLFEFHQNTNGKNVRAHDGLRADSHRFTFKAKISPPRLKKRVGIFSTRSPHRPNPVGITLVKIERVDSRLRTVHISALDLIDGTPVLDIKPYVPAYDAVPSARTASWIAHDLSPTLHAIEWKEPSLLLTLERLASTSQFYKDDARGFRAAVEEVLQADVRSKDQTTKRERASLNELVLDNARVFYRMAAAETEGDRGEMIEIVRVDLAGM